MNYLQLIGRKKELFLQDICNNSDDLNNKVHKSSFLVIGGAGSIGQAVSKEIFKRNPKLLHVLDISENNLVEFVRDVRSSIGYIDGEFGTFALDCGSREYDVLTKNYKYDYVLNLSALKHVRSESNPYTLMRMIEVNILNTIKTIKIAETNKTKKYFCVSTDKAANPVNMMGASKRIMEMFLMRESMNIPISTARFANVAFSDGSLLHGFNQRVLKKQPIAAPNDVLRYFVTPQESGELCLMSCLLGDNMDIFFPKLSEELHLTTFSDIAKNYLLQLGYEPYECSSEQEARDNAAKLIDSGRWPCYFFKSDTSGEKDFEEFYTDNEDLDLNYFKTIGIIKNEAIFSEKKLDNFKDYYKKLRDHGKWSKEDIISEYKKLLPEFNHKETGKYLDQKM